MRCVLVDDNFDTGVVHTQGLAKGAGFAHQHAAPLAQGAVEGFDHVGLAEFGAPVGASRQHGGVGRPLVGWVPVVAAVLL